MIDLRRFPVVEIMALQAILPELIFVRVLMAGRTALRKSQERVPQIFHLDQRLFGRTDVRRVVTLRAGEATVLSLEQVARLSVVEALQRRNPVDQLKIFSVVLGVACGAMFAVGKFGV